MKPLMVLTRIRSAPERYVTLTGTCTFVQSIPDHNVLLGLMSYYWSEDGGQ